MQKFKAILLRDYGGRERCAIVEVMAGGDGFDNKWLVLRPVDLAGSWLVPLVDADRAISMAEAAHIFSYRRGPEWNVRPGRVRAYIHKGTLAPAGRTSRDIGIRRPTFFVSLEAVWKMPFPSAGRPQSKKQEAEKPKQEEEKAADSRCYFDNEFCNYESGLWQCETCEEWFCHNHWHETSLGRNVECSGCEYARQEREDDETEEAS